MNERQEMHLKSIKTRTVEMLDSKYRSGAKEHGGELGNLSLDVLLVNSLEEVIDQLAYLFTALDKSKNETKILTAVKEEMIRAVSMHGTSVVDEFPFRGLAVLTEELGEVAMALLDARREYGRLQDSTKGRRDAIVRELVQLAAAAVLMATKIEEMS